MRPFLLGLAVAAALAAGCGGSGEADPPAVRPSAAVATLPRSQSSLPPSLVGREWSRLPTARKVVALTFDCGGNAAGVPSILATLREKGVRATFFLCGVWTETFPAQARAIAARHAVGNHTYDHPHLPRLSDAAVRREVWRGARAIREVTGEDPKPLFRFPYGDSDSRTIGIVNSLGYGSIRWTVDTLGWKGRQGGQSARTVTARVLAALQPGAIVLMHAGAAPDGTTLDAKALPGLIRKIRARGYRFVTVREFVR